MLVRSPENSALYESSVKELQAAGVELTPADYAELWELSKRATDSHGDVPSFLAPSVEVAEGVVLQRPSIGMLEWLSTNLVPAAEGESDVYWVLAMSWALTHARERDYIAAHSSRRRIRRAVRAFTLRLPWSVTPEDLAWGVTAVLGGKRRHVGRQRVEASGLDWGDYVAGLANRYHLPPEKIMWEMTVEDVEKLAAYREKGGQRVPKAWHELRAVVDDMKAKAKAAKGRKTEAGDGGC